MRQKTLDAFWQKVQKQDGDGCWLWTASKRFKGYGAFVWVNAAGDIVQGRAHRFSWEIHNGPIPEGLCVLHHCDTPACVRPDHLWLGTKADNNRDMQAKGRRVRAETHGPGNYRRGVQHWKAKLNPGKVREIRALVASGRSQASVAREFGVRSGAVCCIVNGKRWKSVE